MTTEKNLETPATFAITPTIEKGKNTINTAQVVAEQLNKCVVKFSQSKTNVPAIYIKMEGEKDFKWLANFRNDWDDCVREYTSVGGRVWHHLYPRNPFGHGYEKYLFEHLTDAAYDLVMQFIIACIEKYDAEFEADKQELQVSVSFSPIS